MKDPTRIDGGNSKPSVVPVTMTPLYKVLSENLSPQIEAFLLTQYVAHSGGKLPSVARAEDLSTKAKAEMKAAIEQAYDLKLPANLVVPNVMQSIKELLDKEFAEEFGNVKLD
jgi:hypothetical protein